MDDGPQYCGTIWPVLLVRAEHDPVGVASLNNWPIIIPSRPTRQMFEATPNRYLPHSKSCVQRSLAVPRCDDNFSFEGTIGLPAGSPLGEDSSTGRNQMPNNETKRSGSDDQGSKSGQQGSKSSSGQQKQQGASKGSQQGSESTRGGSSEQHSKAGQQSHKNK